MHSFPARPSIAILGAGALGGYYGARLAQSGLPVHFLLRSDYPIVKRQGLVIKSIDGDFALPPNAARFYDTPLEMPAVDLVIVTLKTTENHQFPSLIPPLLHDNTAILTLQNGLGNEDDLARLFGAGRILGGMAFTCINRLSPGVIHHQDHGQIKLGEFASPSNSSRARAISDLFISARVACSVLECLAVGRWDKLIWNIPFNGLSALLDTTTDRLISTAHGLGLVNALMEEVIAIAAAQDIHFPTDLPAQKIAHTRTMGPYLTSMHLDRRHRRPMEIDAILGRPLAVACSCNVPAPHLHFLHNALNLLNNVAAT